MIRKYLVMAFITLLALKGNGQTSTSLMVLDTRSDSTTPSSYSRAFEAHFKYGSAIGLELSAINQYYTILGLRGWSSDNSGGKAHELAFSNDGQILFRSGLTPSWEGWKKLVISDVNDNVGIGTADTKGYKLAVAGNMIAESMKVKIQATWPDYVFTKSYELPTLQETEKHIKEIGHLPGIPSAAEVKANGIDLGEMNAKLLQKIDELTLHLIEQNKKFESKISSQEAKLDKQQKEIDALKKQRAF